MINYFMICVEHDKVILYNIKKLIIYIYKDIYQYIYYIYITHKKHDEVYKEHFSKEGQFKDFTASRS